MCHLSKQLLCLSASIPLMFCRSVIRMLRAASSARSSEASHTGSIAGSNHEGNDPQRQFSKWALHPDGYFQLALSLLTNHSVERHLWMVLNLHPAARLLASLASASGGHRGAQYLWQIQAKNTFIPYFHSNTLLSYLIWTILFLVIEQTIKKL